ncbi:hypothetical protein RB595_000470 [Gaeumannomyces hyphopodioides]
MPSRKLQHSRQYDIVLFGATGYTGLYAAEYIAESLPTDLSWAIAGRSRDKLEKIATDLKAQHPDRSQPALEVCVLDDESLTALAKKTAILMTTVGPYCVYGEHAFKACAENGTHYLDVTGEVPWVLQMMEKYEGTAKSNGALMFPQIGIESAPSDLVAFSLASIIREKLGAQTGAVTLSFHIDAAPSGGTIDTVFNVLDRFSLKELSRALKPYALSPVPRPNRPRPKPSLVRRLTGLVTVPGLGLLTTSFAGRTNVAIVERTWGLLATTSSRQPQAYGPNFSFREYMPAPSRLRGFAMHLAFALGGLMLVMTPSPLRRLVRRFLTQPGQGKSREEGAREGLQLRAVADADTTAEAAKQAYCEARFRGSMYHLTAIILVQAALSILEDYDDLQLGGGIYTAACLGQPFIERLNNAGFRFETKIITS